MYRVLQQCRFITQRNGSQEDNTKQKVYAIDSIAILYLILMLMMILISIDSLH